MVAKGSKVRILKGSYAGMVGEVIRVSSSPHNAIYEVFFGINRGKGYIGSWCYVEGEFSEIVSE